MRPEPLTIRPPSEWRSALVRSVRGCNWNRCRFCGIYTAMGHPTFSVRPVSDVIADIDWYGRRMADLTTAFIGDGDPLSRSVDESVLILERLRVALPRLTRITAYARAQTLRRLGSRNLERLHRAGLSRVHIGLESGDLATLKFHCKGQSPKILVDAVGLAKEASIEVSCYVLLGLGGRDRWQEHIEGTVDVINRTDPHFIRVRRIWLYTSDNSQTATSCPLWNDIRSGTFIEQTPEGTVLELRRLVAETGDINSRLVCDHANNYVQVEGRFPHERKRMLSEIDRFLALPSEDRERIYSEVGSRI